MMVHRLLSGVAQSAIDDEQSRWESCFERGEDVCDGDQQLDVLSETLFNHCTYKIDTC